MDFSPQQIKTLQQVLDDRLRLNNDLLRQDINALENRVMAYVDAKTDQVIQAVSHKLDNTIQPQLDGHDRRLTKLETKMI